MNWIHTVGDAYAVEGMKKQGILNNCVMLVSKGQSQPLLMSPNPSNAEATGWYFHPKHKKANIFVKHLNPVMLVFLG